MIEPLPVLAQAVKRVLLDRLRPIRYTDLTMQALASLGRAGAATPEEFRKMAEDVREKVLLARRDGMDYLGRPMCVGVLGEWFQGRRLLNAESGSVRIPLTTSLAQAACSEAALRYPHMLNKTGRSPEEHAFRIAKGMLVEAAVSSWARSMWPDQWRPPLNWRDYRTPCNHDFQLVLPTSGRTMTVDVAGPHLDNRYGRTSAGKAPADLHIMADYSELEFSITGYESGEFFGAGRCSAEQVQPISQFVFRMNCEALGYVYAELLARYTERHAA